MSKLNKNFLFDFCNAIDQELLIKPEDDEIEIHEKDTNNKNDVSGLIIKCCNVRFENDKNKLFVIRQNQNHKPSSSLLCSPNKKNKYFKDIDYKYQTSLSCDFIVLHIKDGYLKLAFCEIKSSEIDYKKGIKQIYFSKIWFKYLCDCYCQIYGENLRIFEQAIEDSKSFIAIRCENATCIKNPIGKSMNNKNYTISESLEDVKLIKLIEDKNRKLILDDINILFNEN